MRILPENNALSNSYFESETYINSHCDSDSKSAEIQEEQCENIICTNHTVVEIVNEVF